MTERFNILGVITGFVQAFTFIYLLNLSCFLSLNGAGIKIPRIGSKRIMPRVGKVYEFESTLRLI
jgi:hypothetical protein